jgi:hypothetical protein
MGQDFMKSVARRFCRLEVSSLKPAIQPDYERIRERDCGSCFHASDQS